MERHSSVTDHTESVQVSRVLRPNPEEQEFISQLTLGVEETLQAHPMIKEIKMIVQPPVSASMLISWERIHGLKLPTDLKNYFSSTNGFRLTWSLDYADEILKIGEMSINTLQMLTQIETDCIEAKPPEPIPRQDSRPNRETYLSISLSEIHKIISETSQQTSKTTQKLSLGIGGKAFRLDSSHPSLGTACLVYPCSNQHKNKDPEIESKVKDGHSPAELREVDISRRRSSSDKRQCEIISPNTQVWFLDPSFHWHFLAPTFSHYYRMMLFHLGLPQWEYRFTPFGVSSWAEQIFWLVAPNLLQPVKNLQNPNMDSGIWSTDVPPDAAQPNSTNNVLNINMFKRKKKDKRTSQE